MRLSATLRTLAAMRLSALSSVLLVLLLTAVASTAQATLSPEAYQLIRARAPLAFEGTVLRDVGGHMDVRVEQVLRGPLQPGAVVAVTYPEDRGVPPPPGAEVYYRRFLSGDRLRIFGQGQPVIYIVHGGIDLLYRSNQPPPKSGGCGACVTAPPGLPTAGGATTLLGCLLLALRRRGRRR